MTERSFPLEATTGRPLNTGTVRLFADAMVNELEHNAHKGTWLLRGDREHFSDLDYHCDKLKAAVRSGAPAERILEFAADVANHAMFVADDRRALERRVIAARATEPEYVRPCWRFWVAMLRYPRSYLSAFIAWTNPRRLGGYGSPPPPPDQTY